MCHQRDVRINIILTRKTNNIVVFRVIAIQAHTFLVFSRHHNFLTRFGYFVTEGKIWTDEYTTTPTSCARKPLEL
jgi:hypothetical protein